MQESFRRPRRELFFFVSRSLTFVAAGGRGSRVTIAASRRRSLHPPARLSNLEGRPIAPGRGAPFVVGGPCKAWARSFRC